MALPILASLEVLATEITRRKWATRAAISSETGDVLFVCDAASVPTIAPSDPVDPAHSREADRAAGTAASVTARIELATLERDQWLYVDLGAIHLLARVSVPTAVDPAVKWLSGQLQSLGVVVEPPPTAPESPETK